MRVVNPDVVQPGIRRRSVAMYNTSTGEQYYKWEIITDVSRPTEDEAFRRVATQDYMIDFIRGGCDFGALEWSILIMERRIMRTPFYHNAVVQIATRYKAPPATIADMLDNIATKMQVRTFLGLPALPAPPIRYAKQLEKADRYNWRDNRNIA